MTPDLPLTRDLVLIGGGHAHALVLRRWGMGPLPGVRLTVVNPGATAPYTGMLPGHVAGHYGRDDLDIDLVRLARFAGAALIDGAVTALDPVVRRLTIPGRPPLDYDVASLDIGIHSRMPDMPGFAEHAVAAKPLGPFAERWRAFLDAVGSGDQPARAVVIGGGIAGAELAMAMAHALRDASGRQVTVVEAAPHLTGVPPAVRARLARALDAAGVTLRTGVRVARIDADGVALEGGERIAAAFVTGAAGARPHAWLADTGLPLHEGFVRIDDRLRVEGRDDLFAVGDCAHMAWAPRPKAGVFAVRQAPVLHDNLRATLRGMGGLRPYRPQRSYLKLISLGGRRALAERAGLAVQGAWLWRLKDRIDRRFMARLTDLPVMPTPTIPRETAQGVRAERGALCGGCGAKVTGDALTMALRALPPNARADVLSRPGDDAAVLKHGTGRQVLTTDHLRALTADPVLMTRIAVVHALGDVWAMGAAPQAALASVVLPRMSETMQARTLAAILATAAEVLGQAGADLVGGHSTMGAEMTLGFAVTGLCSGEPIGHGGARPGDAVVLTRPIGTGALLAAEMAGRARGADVMAMLHAMARPQGDAAAILSGAGARAMTDLTGFGLAGHLRNICLASGVSVDLTMDAIPVYAGAGAAAAAGHRSMLHAANGRAAPVVGCRGPQALLLHDPQTAGGMLAAMPAAAADAAVDRLRAAGHIAACIGTFADGPPEVRAV